MRVSNLFLMMALVLIGCIRQFEDKSMLFDKSNYGATKEDVCGYYKAELRNRLCSGEDGMSQKYYSEYKTEIISSKNIWSYLDHKYVREPEQFFVFDNVNIPMKCDHIFGAISSCKYGDGKLVLVTESQWQALERADPKLKAKHEKEQEIKLAEEKRKHNLYIANLEKKYGSQCKANKANSTENGFIHSDWAYEKCLENASIKASREENEKQLASQLDRSSIGQTCRSFGYKQGTDKYADCMKDLYIQQQNANNSGTTNVIVNDSGSQAIADELKKQNNLQQSEYLLRLSDRLLNPPRAPAVNCSSYAIGGTVQTRCQ